MAVSTGQVDAAKSQYPQIDVYSDAQLMLRKSEADLVIITSPNDSHFDLAKLALTMGKHVLLEKPMTSTSEQALALACLAHQQSLVLSVYHNRRWDGDFLTVQQLIKSSKLGKVKMFSSQFDRFRPFVRDRWREQQGLATGMLYDLGSHLIDQALCLFGAPHSITANCVALRENSKVTDYFKLLLHYENIEVILSSSPYSAGPNLRFQLQGDAGSYVKYGLDPQEQQLHDGLLPSTPAFGIEPPSNYGLKYLIDAVSGEQHVTKIETLAGSYKEYYAQLALAIQTRQNVPVSAMEGAKVIKIIELAIQSAQQRKTVDVDLTGFNYERLG